MINSRTKLQTYAGCNCESKKVKEIKLRTVMFQVCSDFDCDLDMQHFHDYTTLRVMDSIHSKSLYCFYN